MHIRNRLSYLEVIIFFRRILMVFYFIILLCFIMEHKFRLREAEAPSVRTHGGQGAVVRAPGEQEHGVPGREGVPQRGEASGRGWTERARVSQHGLLRVGAVHAAPHRLLHHLHVVLDHVLEACRWNATLASLSRLSILYANRYLSTETLRRIKIDSLRKKIIFD